MSTLWLRYDHHVDIDIVPMLWIFSVIHCHPRSPWWFVVLQSHSLFDMGIHAGISTSNRCVPLSTSRWNYVIHTMAYIYVLDQVVPCSSQEKIDRTMKCMKCPPFTNNFRTGFPVPLFVCALVPLPRPAFRLSSRLHLVIQFKSYHRYSAKPPQKVTLNKNKG